ncbi:transposase [Streptomyces sp. R-74717]|uniref:transposase n=1 Tax=Streptomyces TaxID=1883 RepID=UPI0037B55263
MARGDLTGERWAVPAPLLPKDIAWQDLPAEYGPWGRVYALFRRWRRDGTWHRIFTALQARADA